MDNARNCGRAVFCVWKKGSIMSKKKKYVRTLNEVGNRKYDFDYIKEIIWII